MDFITTFVKCIESTFHIYACSLQQDYKSTFVLPLEKQNKNTIIY